MGSLSQVFWFINEPKVPSEKEMAHHYSHISKTPELMALRRECLKDKKVRENKKEGYGIGD